MANKTFNIVGVSRVRENAPLKLRVANGTKIDNREKVLKRNGHADVFLVMLDTAVDKVGARDFLATNHPDLFAQLKPAKVKGETVDTDETEDAVVETEVEATEDAVVETEVEATEDAVVEATEDAVVEATEDAVVETTEDAVVETEVEATEDAVVELTPEQKLAARRARDAARKREKRAAAKAALVNG